MTTLVTSRLMCAAALAAGATAGCGLSEQGPPALAGPSEFGQSISVAATPDRISQDGVSQALVQATVLDANGKASQGVTLQWSVVAWKDANGNNLPDGLEQEFGTLVEPSTQQSTTDSQGTARILVAAPPAPAVLATAEGKLRVTAKPVNGDAMSTTNARAVVVILVPPPGTLPPNRNPIAAIAIAPATGNINQSVTFDASQTTDEGELCGDRCTYQWDFGDYDHDGGQRVRHTYSRPGTFTVTLTVTDARGGVGSTTRSLTIAGPTAPVAVMSISPATVASGGTVIFDGSGTTVGVGATIEEYAWDFGDGTTGTTTVPIVAHTYTGAGLRAVVLTVTDSLGRTAVATGSVTVSVTVTP